MINESRQFSLIDRIIIGFDNAVHTLLNNNSKSTRENPSNTIPESSLTTEEKFQAVCLMRVNHSGEVCAQALYQGQALTAKSDEIRYKLEQSGLEEYDHLAWCHSRITELGSHTSYLNPLWYAGSFTLGIIAGLAGDKWNLGFIAATEYQVVEHLNNHLQRLPQSDLKSQAILQQMRDDENQHAETAISAGAAVLPLPVQMAMRVTSKLMTYSSYWV